MFEPKCTSILQAGFKKAHENFPFGGLCLEFGVAKGTSFIWQLQQIVKNNLDSFLVGFDSFQGLPKETEGVWYPKRHSKGQFYHPIQLVEFNLRDVGLFDRTDLYRIIPGFFSETLTSELQKELSERKLILVNIDVDLHSSTIQVLDFIRPMLRSGTILYFDDWKDPSDTPEFGDSWGEHRAWAEWSEKNRVKAELGETNNVNQRYLVIQ